MKYLHVLLFFLLNYSVLSLIAQDDKEIVFSSEAENLGNNINSKYTDAEPKISPDGKTLYFCRRQDPGNVGGPDTGPDVWLSVIKSDKKWSKARNIGRPVNDKYFNQVIGIRADGNAMMLKGRFIDTLQTDVYISKRKKGKWSKPLPMGFEDFEYQPEGSSYTVSADFKILILAFADKGESDDLYVSFLNANNKWTKPKYMGDVLNSKEEEVFPTLANDGITLYFSSKGHGGYGDFDIFVSRRLDESWTKWKKPRNMGKAINTSGYDSDFTVDAQGKYAYISSNVNFEVGFDIFRIELPEEAKPNPVALVKGTIIDPKTNKPLEAKISYWTNNKEVGQATSNSSDGIYQIVLPYGKEYELIIETEGYGKKTDYIDLTKISDYKEITKNINLATENTTAITLPKTQFVYFQTAKWNITPKYSEELDKTIKKLKRDNSMSVDIAGYTDSKGSKESNMELSEKRANSIANYFESKGINKSRIKILFYGEANPLSSNNSNSGRAKNRRVEIKINQIK